MRLKQKQHPAGTDLVRRFYAGTDLLDIMRIIIIHPRSTGVPSGVIKTPPDTGKTFHSRPDLLHSEPKQRKSRRHRRRIGSIVPSRSRQTEADSLNSGGNPFGRRTVIRHTKHLVSMQSFRRRGISTEQSHIQMLHTIHTKTFQNLIFQNSSLPGVLQKSTEDLGKFLFGIMVGPDIQDNGMIRGIIQQAFVAFIGFQHTERTSAARIIAGKAVANKMIRKPSGNHGRRSTKTIQRLG